MFKIRLHCHAGEDETVTINCETFQSVLEELGWIRPVAGNYTIVIEPQIPLELEAV